MNDSERKKRIARLKKEIKITLIILLTAPWLVVAVLGVRISKLKSDVNDKDRFLTQYLEQIEMLSQQVMDDRMPDILTESVPSSPEPEPTIREPFDYSESVLSDEQVYDGYRKVYLTFDDGPSTNTAEILDILKEYDVKATFFVIYKSGRDNEALYRRIVDEGHTLGMHSCTHVYSNVYASKEAFLDDTKKLRNFLYMVTGVESDIYRFPGGSSNRVSPVDMKVFADALTQEGIRYYDWNVSSQDATSSVLSKNSIVYNATCHLSSMDDAMILFHDTDSKVTTVEALPEIIEYIQSMDKTVMLPITEGTTPIHHISVE